MISIKVYFSDGDSLYTQFNGTLEEAQNYYVGQKFELDENKPMAGVVGVVRVEQLG